MSRRSRRLAARRIGRILASDPGPDLVRPADGEAPFVWLASGGLAVIHAAPAGPDGGTARPTLSIDAYNGGVMRPAGAFYGARVVIDLAGLQAGSQEIALLLDHYDWQIVGQSRSVKITTGGSGGVTVEGVVTGDVSNPDDPAGKVVMHARNGFRWKASVGVRPERVENVEPNVSVNVNGRSFAGPLYVVRAGVLDEVSLLSIGADRTTAVRVAARPAPGESSNAATPAKSAAGFAAFLAAASFDPLLLTACQRDALLDAYLKV